MAVKNVLIVEDEMVLAMSLSAILADMGYTVLGTLLSGEEAVETTMESCPDLVLMDITLDGEIDGIEAANRINDICSVPVVFLSGYSDPDTLSRLSKTVHYGFIRKPATEHSLRAAIEEALRKHEDG